VNQGRFRADLYFRLNVFPIAVPPLRERREDIPDLIQHFLHYFNRRMNRQVERVDPTILRCLLDYHWPGNVRELENLVERAMIVATEDSLNIDPGWFTPPPAAGLGSPTSDLRDLERRTIVAALENCRGRIYGPHGAAAVLGLKPTTLYGKMRKHGVRKYSSDDEK
jgi:formate hydrogenlyase transcriptional activator